MLFVAAAAAVIVVVGLLDMTPRHVLPSYEATAAQWGSDADFVHRVERTLGAKASVFQLPVVPFPENPPVGQMTDYDHLPRLPPFRHAVVELRRRKGPR